MSVCTHSTRLASPHLSHGDATGDAGTSQVRCPHLPPGQVMSFSGSATALSKSDIFHVPAVSINEARQEGVMEEERDGEERGILAFFGVSVQETPAEGSAVRCDPSN